jgi:hypothetical protein
MKSLAAACAYPQENHIEYLKVAAHAAARGILVTHDDGIPYIDGHRIDRFVEMTGKSSLKGHVARTHYCFVGNSH